MWKKLRDGYRQALNKKKCTTGQAATSINPWKYEKIMEFILPYMANRPRSTNAVIEDSSSNISQDKSENTLQQEFENNATKVTQNVDNSIYGGQSPSMNAQSKRKNSDPFVQFLHDESQRRENRSKIRDALRRDVLTQRQQNDSVQLKSFFDTMYETSKVLPEYTQMKLQRQIFNIVMEARENHITEQLPNSSTPTSNIIISSNVPFRVPTKMSRIDTPSPNRSHSPMSSYSDIQLQNNTDYSNSPLQNNSPNYPVHNDINETLSYLPMTSGNSTNLANTEVIINSRGINSSEANDNSENNDLRSFITSIDSYKNF